MKEENTGATSTISQSKWLTIFRILLGLVLFWKGISFLRNSPILIAYLQKAGIPFVDARIETFSFIVTYSSLLCGFFIIIGLFTRWASIVQIPILIGAVLFVNMKEGMAISNGELILSIITLILLIVFAIKGSGFLSADEYFRNYYKAGYETGHTPKVLE